jgi:hypothetical protein
VEEKWTLSGGRERYGLNILNKKGSIFAKELILLYFIL